MKWAHKPKPFGRCEELSVELSKVKILLFYNVSLIAIIFNGESASFLPSLPLPPTIFTFHYSPTALRASIWN